MDLCFIFVCEICSEIFNKFNMDGGPLSILRFINKFLKKKYYRLSCKKQNHLENPITVIIKILAKFSKRKVFLVFSWDGIWPDMPEE